MLTSAGPAGARQALPNAGLPLDAYRPKHGDHLCSVWTDPSQDRRAAGLFLRGGGVGEGAVWVQDPSRNHLPQEGPPYLVAYSTSHVHLDGGTFDPARLYGFWRERSAEAQARSVTHLRAVAEMVWALQERPGTEHAGTFESGLNPVLFPLPVSVICQYGSIRFRSDTVLAMLLSHPLVVIGERVFTNPFYVPDEEFSARFERLGLDPVGSLIPIWRHFLHRIPSQVELAAFLCNSVPMVLPAATVTVQLDGQPHAYRFDVSQEVLSEGEPHDAIPARGSRLFAIWPGGAGMVGGSVHAAAQGTWSLVEATFDGPPSRVTLSRQVPYSRSELMMFTTLASSLASALAGLSLRGRRLLPEEV